MEFLNKLKKLKLSLAIPITLTDDFGNGDTAVTAVFTGCFFHP